VLRCEAVITYGSSDAGIAKTAKNLGATSESLRVWVRKYENASIAKLARPPKHV